jgi:hypothetical protein
MNNPSPLRHVGQTARPEESTAPDGQSGDAGNQARQENPSDKPLSPAAKPQDPKAKKKIPDLKPGEPPPESSAGS